MRLGDAELHNAAELVAPGDGPGAVPCRVPDSVRVTLNENARTRATCGAGVEIRFNLNGERARVTLRCPEGPALAEVWHGPFMVRGEIVGTEPTPVEVARPALPSELLAKTAGEHGLRFDPGLVRILLPYTASTIVGEVEGDVSPPRAEQVPKTRWLAYGSSITQGARALRPSGTYAMRAAEHLGADLVNLGFGGGAHLEPDLADYIASRDDWDLCSMELGINVAGWMETAEFERRVDRFVSKIVDARPDKWVFCIDIFLFREDLEGVPGKGAAFREIVRRKVASVGSPKVIHVPGTDILKSPSGLTEDLVHPAPAGMEEMAENLAAVIRERTGLRHPEAPPRMPATGGFSPVTAK